MVWYSPWFLCNWLCIILKRQIDVGVFSFAFCLANAFKSPFMLMQNPIQVFISGLYFVDGLDFITVWFLQCSLRIKFDHLSENLRVFVFQVRVES